MLSLLIALSVATERVVEIVKGAVPRLNQTAATPEREGVRRCVLQALAVGAGVLTVYLAGDSIPPALFKTNTGGGIAVLGLLASGGSGFWNAVLTYVLQAKNAKTNAADAAKVPSASSGNA